MGISWLVDAIQLIYYRELSAIPTTKNSKSYIQRRAPEREEEQDYLKILFIRGGAVKP